MYMKEEQEMFDRATIPSINQVEDMTTTQNFQ